MELKITTLIENMPDAAGELLYEHGLSLYIEFHGKKILFDTGQSGDFLKNAGKLGKSMKDLDAIIISHGHYDHSGGVPALLEVLERETPLYVGAGFFQKKHKLLSDGSFRYNGNPFEKEALPEDKVRLRQVGCEVSTLWEDVLLFRGFERTSDFEALNPKFYVEKDGVLELDAFGDEVALGLRTEKGLVLVVGCSHVGISNILQSVSRWNGEPIYAVLGGTHLIEAEEERLEKTMDAFQACGVKCVAVSHCTGEAGIAKAQEVFGERFVLNNTGNVFEL